MKLQHLLEDISKVKDAFKISNFIKIETTSSSDIYWFTSMQKFRFVPTTGCFEYSDSLYTREISHPWEDTYDAFFELKSEIDNAILTGNAYSAVTSVNGWTGPNGNGNVVNPIYPNSATKEAMNKIVTGADNSTHNPLFCSCKSPNLVKSNAGGEVFDYCKDCKKEHKAEVKSIGKDSEPDGLYFF